MNGLPGADIQFDNGNIGNVIASADGLFGLLASGVAVAGTFELQTPYILKGMVDVAKLGILPTVDNYKLFKTLREFYEEAGEGTELHLMAFDRNSKVSDWFTADPVTGKVPAQKILDTSNGAINALFTSYSPLPVFAPSIVNGLDEDVELIKQKAQLFATNYLETKKAPVFVVVEGYAFNGKANELKDLTLEDKNRVAVFIGDTEKRTGGVASYGASNHVFMGRLAAIPVHENAGRVKRGPLTTLYAYVVDEDVKEYDVEDLHNKGYLTFRTHVRKAGYYIADDPMATNPKDDYKYISRRRVIDKAYRVAFGIATDEINEHFDLQNDGTVDPYYAKAVEAVVEGAIYETMTRNNELSVNQADKDDLGVVATFDLTTNVAQTSRTKMNLKIRPKGTNRWFDILLGFDVNLNN